MKADVERRQNGAGLARLAHRTVGRYRRIAKLVITRLRVAARAARYVRVIQIGSGARAAAYLPCGTLRRARAAHGRAIPIRAVARAKAAGLYVLIGLWT